MNTMTFSGRNWTSECGRPSPTGERRALNSRSPPGERLRHSVDFSFVTVFMR